jgi:hypothetical protein
VALSATYDRTVYADDPCGPIDLDLVTNPGEICDLARGHWYQVSPRINFGVGYGVAWNSPSGLVVSLELLYTLRLNPIGNGAFYSLYPLPSGALLWRF